MASGALVSRTGPGWGATLARVALVFVCCWVPPAAGADYGPVRPGDTLWQVAGRVQAGPGLDRNQVMLALLWANPQAVTPSCNVNGTLRVGVRLRVPGPAEMGAVDPQTARRTLAQQSREWSEHRRGGRPLECPPPPAPTPAPGATPVQAPVSTPIPVPIVAPSAPADAGADVDKPAAKTLPQGPTAPVWALVLLTLGLIWVGVPLRRVGGGPPRSFRAVWEALVRLPRRPALRLAFGSASLLWLLALAGVVGVLGAFATALFREGMIVLARVYGGTGPSLALIAVGLSPWERLLVPTVGGLIAGLILQEIGGRLRGRTDSDYMAAVRAGDGWISVRQSLVRAGSSLFSVASGGSIGREGAMVQLAAMVASALGRVLRLPPERLRLLVAAGAAAGLAAAYGAPLASAIFVAEIVVGSIVLDSMGPLIVAAVVASVTVHSVLGYEPMFQFQDLRLLNDWEMALCLVLGLIAGHLAPLLLRLFEIGTRWFGRLPLPLALRLGLGGLIVGTISLYEPQVWGNGHTAVDSVLLAPWTWQALATLLLLKVVATAATVGSGAVGGAFTPALFVGAVLGLLFGSLVDALLPAGVSPASVYAVVGMGAVLAGITRAPLTAILMILEMTMNQQLVLPLMLAVVIAHYTAARYTWIRPMYAETLLPRSAAPG